MYLANSKDYQQQTKTHTLRSHDLYPLVMVTSTLCDQLRLNRPAMSKVVNIDILWKDRKILGNMEQKELQIYLPLRSFSLVLSL